MKLTLADFIAMNIRSFPDRPAIEVLGAAPESYTYREMWLRVSALADALREVEPGPHGPVAATLLPNSCRSAGRRGMLAGMARFTGAASRPPGREAGLSAAVLLVAAAVSFALPAGSVASFRPADRATRPGYGFPWRR